MAKQAASFRNEFDELAREIDHPGESGTAREHALRELLRRYLPRRVAVDTGFVIDAAGGQSRQVDVVLYDRDSATVWDVSGVKYFPCETVIAVGEVKTRIRTTRTLVDALNAVRSVKALDRSNGGTNLPITGPGYSMTPPFTFDPTQPRDQILGFVFTGDSMNRPRLRRGPALPGAPAAVPAAAAGPDRASAGRAAGYAARPVRPAGQQSPSGSDVSQSFAATRFPRPVPS
jgi:hypothetical protein